MLVARCRRTLRGVHVKMVGVAARVELQRLLNELSHAVFEVISDEQEQAQKKAEAAARAQRRALGYLYVLPVGPGYVKIGWILDPQRIAAKKGIYWSRYEWTIGVPWVSAPLSHVKPDTGGYSDLMRLKDMLLAYAHKHSDGHRPTFTTQGSAFERIEFELFHADFDLVRDHAIELTSRAEVHLAV